MAQGCTGKLVIMSIRAFTDADYPMVSEWWKAHGRMPVSVELLPPTGIVVDDIMAAWLIKTDAGVGIIEHAVSSPHAKPRDVHTATQRGMDALIYEAALDGLKQVWGVVCNRGLSKAYERRGFAKQNGIFNVFVGAL